MPPNQESPKLSKAESARINGAKSQGATSPEGKIGAANGNLKHGAYSSRVIMQREDPEIFAQLRACLLEVFQPQDSFEDECVDTLVNTRWRIRRMEAAETDGLNAAVLLNKPYVEAQFQAIDVSHERALGMQADSLNLERNTRVEERLHRIYERNFKLLASYRRKSGRSIPPTPQVNSGFRPFVTPAGAGCNKRRPGVFGSSQLKAPIRNYIRIHSL